MDRARTLRNVAIVAALAAAIYLIPGGGPAKRTFEAVLWSAFAIGIAYLGLRLYREHRVSLNGLGDRHRGMLYGAVALGIFEYAARWRMWLTGLGELLWFVLAGAVVYALMEVFRHSRTY
jgi:hypothetical protein